MKVNYDHVAATYDRHRGGGGPYMESMLGLARRCQAATALEVGAGTGNNTQAFAEAYPCALIGLELSGGMLARAREKAIAARWIQGDMRTIPLAEDSVDFVFGCYVLHHLASLEVAFGECARVLRRGCAAFVTAPLDFIARHPMNAYFPSFAEVDTKRFQGLDDIEQAFLAAGFRHVESRRHQAPPRWIDSAFVERVAGKFVSTYLLIPDEEFRCGLDRLRADVARTGHLEAPLVWESLVVWGEL